MEQKEAFNAIMHGLAEKFYFDVQMGKYPIPSVGKGKDKYLFEVGQRVKLTASARRKQGLQGTVTQREKINGYAAYSVDLDSGEKNLSCRQQDIEII